MPAVYGTDYMPLIARIERGHHDNVIAKLPLSNGNEQLAFLPRNHDLRHGDEVEVMITGVIHPRDRGGRINRNAVTALLVRQIDPDYDVMMAIAGFAQPNRRELPQAIAFESYGEIVTEARARQIIDQRTHRPLSHGLGIARTRMVTPGRTGARYQANSSNAYRERVELDDTIATQVWVDSEDLDSEGKQAIAIEGLSRIEDLAVGHLIEGKPEGYERRRAA